MYTNQQNQQSAEWLLEQPGLMFLVSSENARGTAMKRTLISFLTTAVVLWAASGVRAEEAMVQMDIGRGDARLPVYVMSNPEATATVILLPGGDAGTGKIVDGKPVSGNFLSRSRGKFLAEPGGSPKFLQ